MDHVSISEGLEVRVLGGMGGGVSAATLSTSGQHFTQQLHFHKAEMKTHTETAAFLLARYQMQPLIHQAAQRLCAATD